MYMNENADSECKRIIELYQKKIENQKAENVPLLFKSFYDAVIDNKDILFEKISNIRNAKELAIYMRNGSFAEDALDDFAALMFASIINEEIISDYNEFVKQLYEILKKNNYKSNDFKQFTEAWSNKMIQKTMNDVKNRRLNIVEIGTGIGSEFAKKIHGFLFGKTTEIAVTVIMGSSSMGKLTGKAMRKYLGKGEFSAQRDVLAKHVLENIEDYANELAQWCCDGYNDIYDSRIKMAGQLLVAYFNNL